MKASAALEALRRSPRSETQWRLVALEMGGALHILGDEELAELDEGLARLQAAESSAPPWFQGFRSALGALLSGAQQQRERARERRALDGELAEMPLRPDWQRLLPLLSRGVVQQAQLARLLKMDRAQVNRNIKSLIEAGLLQEVFVQPPGTPERDRRVHHYRLTALGRQAANRLVQRETRPAAPVSPPASIRSQASVDEQRVEVIARRERPERTYFKKQDLRLIKKPRKHIQLSLAMDTHLPDAAVIHHTQRVHVRDT